METPTEPETTAKKSQAIELMEELLKHGRELLMASTTHLAKNLLSKVMLMGLVLFVGLVLVSLRIAIFFLIPPVLKNIIPETLILDLLLTYVSAETFVVATAWHILAEVVDKVTLGAVDFPPIGAPTKFNVYNLKPQRLESAISTFAVTCAPYDSISTIVGRSFRVFLGPVVCPVLRYVYPVPWLYKALYFMVGWMSPDPTPAGFDGENNCKEDPESFAWPCAVVGMGYIILELVLPLVIVFILIETLLPALVRVLWTLTKIDILIATSAARAVVGVFKTTNAVIIQVIKDKDV